MKKGFLKAVGAIALTAAFMTTTTIPAHAAQNYYISGTVGMGNELIQFQTGRYHATGPASMNMNYVQSCGGGVKLGLRNASGTQITTSVFWDRPANKSFYNTGGPNPASIISGGTLFVNGSGFGAGCALRNLNFNGWLYL